MSRKLFSVITESDKKLPELVWFDGEMEDWEEYAEALGIDTDLPKEEACDFIRVFFDMITRYDLDAYQTEDLYAFCDRFNIDKKESNTRNKALKELNKAFTQHMMGERDEFSNLTKIVEETAQMPKEREEYPREPDYVTIAIDEKECKSDSSSSSSSDWIVDGIGNQFVDEISIRR